MTWDDLKGRPKFRDLAHQIVEFARDAEWIIHNAPFDVAFLDREFEYCSLPACVAMYGSLIDTLALARDAFPGKRNNLEALCERFGVSNAHRTLHGALLDAQLLAEVYLAMTRGQESLTIDMGARADRRRRVRRGRPRAAPRAGRAAADPRGARGARGLSRSAGPRFAGTLRVAARGVPA